MELTGIMASIIIIFSMVFKTTTFKGTMLMRTLNTVGSVLFIIYGLSIPAYSTAICNCCALLINIFYIFKETKDYKRNLK
jgi:hypothetical protein